MPRPHRQDAVNAWHHLSNVALNHRTYCEDLEDYRYFCYLIACEVHRGTLEVHEFSLMLTHYHMLVRSPTGQLAEAMHRIQTRYSRRFNLRRGRTGPLVKGRFDSQPIHDLAYRRNVAVYIRDNAVDANIVAKPEQYEWSSAALRASRKSPSWLCDDWVDSEIKARGVQTAAQAFPSRARRKSDGKRSGVDELTASHRRWIERRLGTKIPDDLEDTTMANVRSVKTVKWAIRQTKLADGSKPFRPISPSTVVEQVVKQFTKTVGPLLGLIPRSVRDAWANMKAGVLRALSGSTERRIGLAVNRHESTVCRYLKEHREILARAPMYEVLQAQITEAVMEQIGRRPLSVADG
jgi:REP element-mobilizing transposase RayT